MVSVAQYGVCRANNVANTEHFGCAYVLCWSNRRASNQQKSPAQKLNGLHLSAKLIDGIAAARSSARGRAGLHESSETQGEMCLG